MGLGSLKDVTLEQARNAREDQRRILKSGQNPTDARRDAKRADAGPKTGKRNFGHVADAFIKSKGAGRTPSTGRNGK